MGRTGSSNHESPFLSLYFRGIGKTLFLWFLAISLIPLILVSFVSYQTANHSLLNERQQSLSATIELKKKYIETFFDQILKDLELQSQHDANINFLNELQLLFASMAAPGQEFVKNEWWIELIEQYDVDLKEHQKILGYDDLLFIGEKGNILYTVMKNDDLGMNVFDGEYSKTQFGAACRKAYSISEPIYSDLERYPNSNQDLASFMVQSMINKHGDKVGLLALRISTDQIDNIMQGDIGLGKSGETYLLGQDRIMRSNSRLTQKTTVLEQQVNSIIVDKWLNGDSDRDSALPFEAYKSYRGSQTLGMIEELTYLEKLGIQWAVLAEIDEGEVLNPAKKLRNLVIGVMASMIFILFLAAALVTRQIVKPIRKLSKWSRRVSTGDLAYLEITTPHNEIGELNESFKQVVDSFWSVADVCEAIALGDYSKSVRLRSEHDVLGQFVNQMAENLRAVVRQADAVAKGNYTAEITPCSEKDELGIALLNMTSTLSAMTKANEKQAWLKAGITELNDLMRGEQDVVVLGSKVINFLADYLDASVGAFYVLDNDDALQLSGSFAHEKNRQITNAFQLGESLVGQAALKKTTLTVNKVPENYVRISSGTGDAPPCCLIIAPFLFENMVKGVVELGSFKEFSQLQLEFIEAVTGGIGIAVSTAESRDRVEKLLIQSQHQAESLQTQQEELRQTNEVLETQTNALKESEQTLQAQQEELRVSNEELEERTKALEKQRDAVRSKNRELEEARREIEQKAMDLEVSSKYKSEFLANMSHELRTPMNSIIILSQLLAMNENDLTSKQLEYAQTINSSGIDLLELINEVLDLSKVEAGHMEIHLDDMKISEVTHSIERNFREIANDKGLDLTIETMADTPPQIKTDQQRFHQILKNLVSNAFKFTERGGVTFRAYRPGSDIDFSRSGLDNKQAVAFAVIDTGIGIPEDKQKIIFEAFQQVDGTTVRKFGGTGLGLSISREFAQLLGGEIQMKSSEGKGSTFVLYLPQDSSLLKSEGSRDVDTIKDQPQAKPEMKQPTETTKLVAPDRPLPPEIEVIDDRKDINTNDKTLLIIEDDPNFARTLLNLAHDKDFKCVIAHDGESGLHFAGYYKPSAIILDIGLPSMNGWEVMERLKADSITRHIPVHFISAFDKSMDAMKMGAIGYLTKPVSMEQLENAFTSIEHIISSPVKKLLVVEDNEIQRKSIVDLIGNGDVVTTAVATGDEAYKKLLHESFDCMILDLGLEDMSGFELLEKSREDDSISDLPIIIYTGRDLTREEEVSLQKYAESIVIKGARSPERLLSETTLFLHRVEAQMPKEKQRMLKLIHNKETILQDKKVLLVDDDMRNVFALSNALEGKGMAVIVGRTGKECLDKLEQHPDIDLVLMDIMMPEMDGYEAMQKIRKQKQFKGLPIIALTAKAMKGDRHKCVQAGANDYLAKPVELGKLFSLLRVWLYR